VVAGEMDGEAVRERRGYQPFEGTCTISRCILFLAGYLIINSG